VKIYSPDLVGISRIPGINLSTEKGKHWHTGASTAENRNSRQGPPPDNGSGKGVPAHRRLRDRWAGGAPPAWPKSPAATGVPDGAAAA